MHIEFDPEKAAANPLNHEGITFDEAKPVLLDPYALTPRRPGRHRRTAVRDLGHGRKRADTGGRMDSTRRSHSPDFRLESQSTPEETL